MEILLDLTESFKSLFGTFELAVSAFGWPLVIAGFLCFTLIMAAFSGAAALITTTTGQVSAKIISHVQKTRG